MLAMKVMSDAARHIDTEARAYVDRVDRDHYEGRMSLETTERVYWERVHYLVMQSMQDELKPYQELALRYYTIRLHSSAIELPHALKDAIDGVISKWHGLYGELA